jgi:hypothetical protein
MNEEAHKRPMLNSTPGPGALTRCYKATCAVCKRTEIVDAHDKRNDAVPQLQDLGWKRTTKLTDSDSRHWICPAHHEPGSYKVYRDKENEHRVELGPGDVRGLGE